jgi:hypothetical protein
MANGIPQLLGSIAGVTNTVALLTADAQNIANMFGPPQWGVYLNGAMAISPDSFSSFDHKKDWRISDFPQQEGAFESYNKVATPYDARVSMTKGGTVSDRLSFLQSAQSAAASLNLYDILTPEQTYKNCNITHIDLRRTATNGVTLLTVDLWFEEIRIAASAKLSNTAAPSGADPVNGGTVQATQPTAFQQNQINTAISNNYGF